jgi:hypothetical protein
VSADKDILYRIAYDEAVRALSEQQAVTDGFRSRAGLLLSSTAITTSFLGAQTFNGGHLTVTSWMALAAFLGVAGASLAILWPQRWDFTASPRDIIETYIEGKEAVPPDHVHKELSFHMNKSYLENRAGLEHLAVCFQLASGLLTLEVFLWIISFATSS